MKSSTNTEPSIDEQEILINHYNQGDFKQALDQTKEMLKQFPDSGILYNLQGIFHLKLKLFDKAIVSFTQSLKIDPALVEPRNNLAATHNEIGLALKDKGDLDKAIYQYELALEIQPQLHQAYNNIGVALQESRKLKDALESYHKALKIKPDNAQAFRNIGVLFYEQKEFEAAIKNYKQALSIRPDYVEAHNNIGEALEQQGKLAAAIECYGRSLRINPDNQEILARKLARQANICDWSSIEKDRKLIARLGISEKPIAPLDLLALEDAPERHKLRSEIYSGNRYGQEPLSFDKQFKKKTERLRIGYFSADFRNHAVAYLMARIFEAHNRDYFEIFGFSIGPAEDSEMRRRLEKGFDTFYDVRAMSDRDIALFAKQNKIDIAIDLTGYTLNGRPGIFAHRAAAIQINYLGYPGTMGAAFIDYIIADKYLIPKESQHFYSEKVIYMPHHYQAQNDTVQVLNMMPTREELGLPLEKFVFCSINNSYKITRSEFDIWMRLLLCIEGSVLWLVEVNRWAKENLLKEADARGVSSERLIFAKRTSHSKYLAQFKEADLFLDTFIYNAGATASDALWAGLPVLTKSGHGYASRMAGSLLSSLGLPEMIVTTESQYEQLALRLAREPEALGAIKRKLETHCDSSPFFSTKLFAEHLENAYQQAYQIYRDGKNPETIFVSK